MKGRAKKTTGRATGNKSLREKGRLEEEKGQWKKAGEAVKDAAKGS